jgi:hypothetical protein
VYVVYLEERGGAYRILAGKPEGKRPLGKPMRRWEDNESGSSRSGTDGAQAGLIW